MIEPAVDPVDNDARLETAPGPLLAAGAVAVAIVYRVDGTAAFETSFISAQNGGQ